MRNAPVRVAYARCASYADRRILKESIEKALAVQLEDFGGVSGKKIMLKPNLLAWRRKEDIACVHPAFVVESARAFLDAGASEVAIIENPAVQTAPAIIKSMGIAGELAAMNVKVANFERFAKISPPENVRFKNIEAAQEYLEFDAVCDIAKAKTHGMMKLTLCVKNLFGLVKGSERMGWHLAVGRDFVMFADMLLDIYLTVRPQFNLLDAITCMEGNGPGSGSPAERGFIAGASDSLALDSSVAPLLGVDDLLILKNAERRALLERYAAARETLLFHSAPQDVDRDVRTMFEVFGERRACAVREITKVHESCEYFALAGGLSGEKRGEYVLLVKGAEKRENPLNLLSEREHIAHYVARGMSEKEALKAAAKDRGVSKSELYKFTIKEKGE